MVFIPGLTGEYSPESFRVSQTVIIFATGEIILEKERKCSKEIKIVKGNGLQVML